MALRRAVEDAGTAGEGPNGDSMNGEDTTLAIIDSRTDINGVSQEDRDIDLDTQEDRDGRVEVTIGDPTETRMKRASMSANDRGAERDHLVLSWSEGRAIKGIEDTGESIKSMAERTAGFDDEIVAYAMSVHGGHSGSERGISVNRGRQNGSQSDSQTNLVPSSRASGDTDVASQGSDHSHIELGVGGSDREIKAKGIQKEVATTSGSGEMAGSYIWGMSGSKKHPPPPKLPLGHEEPAQKIMGKGAATARSVGGPRMEKERDVGPTTPMGRGTARRTETSPEQFATPGRGKSCWKVRAYSDGEHFRGT